MHEQMMDALSPDVEGLETCSLRGLPRPADDRYADQRGESDPVFAVWGSKAG